MYPQLTFQIAVYFIPLFIKNFHGVIDRCQLLACVHARFVVYGAFLEMHKLSQAAHADHEKFVQIAGKNRDKFKTFQ